MVCPDLIMPSEWAQAIVGLIMGRYNDIIHQLDRGRCRPLYDIDTDENIFWETWIEGFVKAMRLARLGSPGPCLLFSGHTPLCSELLHDFFGAENGSEIVRV